MITAHTVVLVISSIVLGCGGSTPDGSRTRSESEPVTLGAPIAASDSDSADTPATKVEPDVEPKVEPGGRLDGIVAAHNSVRERHCAQPLVWSTELAAFAQDWANQLRDRSCAFEHRPRNRFGENLSFLSPVGLGSPDGIVGSWYSEVKKYDFGKPGFSFEAGHFTQVVWKGSSQLGCGIAECDNAELWVCNYATAGNVEGSFKTEVLPTSCR